MDDLMQAILNYAFDHQIGFQMIPLKPTTPSFSECSQRYIVINSNWWQKNELPFITAHEIAHIIRDDVNINYYNQSKSVISHKERMANLTAIDIIIPIYFQINDDYAANNVIPIMEQLCIPVRYLNHVKEAAKKYIWYK